MTRKSLPVVVGTASVLIAVLVAMALAAYDLQIRRRSGPTQSPAQALAEGMSRGRVPLPAEPEDETLSDDVAAAGAMWAERHRPLNLDECPDYTADFRKGCADYITGVAH